MNNIPDNRTNGNRWSRAWPVVIVVGAAMIVFGWRMWSVPLTNWDEGIYAHVNLEMYRSHDWGQLTYWGKSFLEKPALQFWLTQKVMWFTGPTEFAMRIWSVLAGVMTAGLIALWSWQARRNKWWAVFAGLIFVTGRFAVAHAFRTGDLDGLATFFIVLALYGYWRSAAKPRWWYVWGVGAALAIMTKSLVGAIPLIVVGLDVVLGNRWKQLPWRHVAGAVGALILVAAPWHIYETIRFGQTFWDNYLGFHVIKRAEESLFNSTPWHWYFSIVRDRFFPWSGFVPLAVIFSTVNWWRKKNPLDRLLLIWSLSVFIIFTLINTRREWYILPLYPALAMMVARMAMSGWNKLAGVWRWGFFASVAATVFILPHAIQKTQALWKMEPYRYLPSIFTTTMVGRWAVGIMVAVILWGIAYVVHRMRKWNAERIMIILAFVIFGGLTLGWSVTNIKTLPKTLPLKTIATYIEQHQITAVTAVGLRLKSQPAGYWYLRRLDGLSVTEISAQNPVPNGYILIDISVTPKVSGQELIRAGKFRVFRR